VSALTLDDVHQRITADMRDRCPWWNGKRPLEGSEDQERLKDAFHEWWLEHRNEPEYRPFFNNSHHEWMALNEAYAEERQS
jgi:hypothetical protein